MSENENQLPPQDTNPPNTPTSEISNTSPDKIQKKENDLRQSSSSSNNNNGLDGCAGASLGFVAGCIHLVVMCLLIGTIKKGGFIIAALILFAVFYLAKKKNTVSFFWGFLIPSMLLLLIYGICG